MILLNFMKFVATHRMKGRCVAGNSCAVQEKLASLPENQAILVDLAFMFVVSIVAATLVALLPRLSIALVLLVPLAWLTLCKCSRKS